jgi:TRAP-type C4-dicarboxylate transport system permease small subunit
MHRGTNSGSRLRLITGQAENVLLWIFTILLLGDVLLGIVARYIQFSQVFADELGKYLFIWLCTIGLSAATKDNQHVRLSFISANLPFSRKGIRLISQSLFLMFSLFFLYWSFMLTLMHFEMDKSVMGFHFPMYWFTAAVPVGFALTSLRLIQDIHHLINAKRDSDINDKNELANEPL